VHALTHAALLSPTNRKSAALTRIFGIYLSDANFTDFLQLESYPAASSIEGDLCMHSYMLVNLLSVR
jgi:hypothetical protein